MKIAPKSDPTELTLAIGRLKLIEGDLKQINLRKLHGKDREYIGKLREQLTDTQRQLRLSSRGPAKVKGA